MFEHMKKMALFLLKAREVGKVSQTALDDLADFTIIIQETFQQLKTDVNACLEMNGMNLSLFQGLEEVFHDPCQTEPFKHLDTRLLQEKFFSESTCNCWYATNYNTDLTHGIIFITACLGTRRKKIRKANGTYSSSISALLESLS